MRKLNDLYWSLAIQSMTCDLALVALSVISDSYVP